MESIRCPEDIQALRATRGPTLLVTYRGDWCPFCRHWLSQLEASTVGMNDVSIFAISVDTPAANAKLAARLNLSFQLLSDEKALMVEALGVQTGKGHGKDPYLQPAVFIYNSGVRKFAWLQAPKLLNMGGAINRLSVADVISELERYRR